MAAEEAWPEAMHRAYVDDKIPATVRYADLDDHASCYPFDHSVLKAVETRRAELVALAGTWAEGHDAPKRTFRHGEPQPQNPLRSGLHSDLSPMGDEK